ncbi:hypothetical protein [Bovifimicola ammoniilytica]|uniref:hypothetical protein n=1 Tax=Bovifimicola ammoniilytica TaxID=2981720 RepID=UPI00033C0BEA|nr:hypothetical protein [Bovifimicola ammoniilytica]MCU6754113.1 hypothetical protein [Bovifimicola ammoniilytica]CCZ03694.1 putative uncharacterized protein [Eubacterium sp. CAG:603]SCJ80448.1 Uncharacterised protein [uncultured Eubacterium sp.]
MVIWQRKKNLIIALLSGVIISAVILGSILIVEVINYNTCREELVKIKNEQKGYANIKAYSLNADKKKGDLITEADLVELNLYGENNLIGLASRSDLVNKELKIDVSKGTIMDLSMVHKQDKIADDIRLHIYSYVELHSDILEGSIVDIRITFPDGEDYVIAGHKKIVKRIENSILINVNEEEILKMASAEVDKNVYQGTKIYAVLYVKDYQETAKSDYPVNASVIELGSWDPNLIDEVFNSETANKRVVLETNMNRFVS